MTSTIDLIRASDLPEPEAARLLAAVVGCSLSEIRAGRISVTPTEEARFATLSLRRAGGEPLQYLEGTAPFGPIEVAVDRRVLIPRPETEQLYERALARMPASGGTVIDVGTGSGALAIALARAAPGVRVIATDVSASAIEVARANAAAHAVSVEFVVGSIFEGLSPALRGLVDVVVANPPYVSEREWDALPVDVRDHEPRIALVAGEDGLAVIRPLLREAPEWLRSGGWLLMECGETQGREIEALAGRAFAGAVEQDLAGRDRFLVARHRPGQARQVDEAVARVRRGEIIGLPTDTVYGVAVDATDSGALARLAALKERPPDKPVAVLVASIEQAERIADFPGRARRAAKAHWPGPLTVVVPWRDPLPPGVGDAVRGTVGVRVPDHATARAILAAAGPLAVTSANPSGAPPPPDAEGARAYFGPRVAVYVEGESGAGEASTVVDFSREPLVVLRPGPVPTEDITTLSE